MPNPRNSNNNNNNNNNKYRKQNKNNNYNNNNNNYKNNQVGFKLPTMQPVNVGMRYLSGLMTEAQEEMVSSATTRANEKISDFNTFNAYQATYPNQFENMTYAGYNVSNNNNNNNTNHNTNTNNIRNFYKYYGNENENENDSYKENAGITTTRTKLTCANSLRMHVSAVRTRFASHKLAQNSHKTRMIEISQKSGHSKSIICIQWQHLSRRNNLHPFGRNLVFQKITK